MQIENSRIKIIRKIIFISIIIIGLLVVGVFAARSDINYVTIKFSDDTSISVVTTKTKVSDILSENNIVLLDDEMAIPSLNSDINMSRTIEIVKNNAEVRIVAEEVSSITTEEILGHYVTITEKIITEQVEIPYETVTKDVSQSGTETKDTVLREGENGLKEVKYKAKFQEDEEIERTVISEEIIKEPVDKIIQVSSKVVSRSSASRAISSGLTLSASVEGLSPAVSVKSVSAYTATGNRTASGAMPSSCYTVAAGPSYPLGTIIYIPYFANYPNAGWFVVEDRGGAITDGHIDVYMDTYTECVNFGRRNLDVYVY